MLPTSAVSGFYFGHRDSQYFGVARIGRDQLEDYAARRGVPLDEARALAAAESGLADTRVDLLSFRGAGHAVEPAPPSRTGHRRINPVCAWTWRRADRIFAGMTRLLLVTLLACLLVWAVPTARADRRRRRSPSRRAARAIDALADAVAAIGGGSGTILIAPGRYRQCAVQEAGRIAFVAARARHRDLRRRHLRGQGRAGAARPLGAGSTASSSRICASPTATAPASASSRATSSSATACSATARTASSSPTTIDGTVRIEQSTFSGLGRCPEDLGCCARHLHRRLRQPDRHPHPLRARHRRPLSQEPRPRIDVIDCSFDDSAGPRRPTT